MRIHRFVSSHSYHGSMKERSLSEYTGVPVDDVNYHSDDTIIDGNSDGKKNFFAGEEAPLQRMVQVQKIHQVAYFLIRYDKGC